MKHSHHHDKHQKDKAIRQSQWEEPLRDEKRPSEKLLSQNLSREETLRMKEGRAEGDKRSKRTSPSETREHTSPQHTRVENERWKDSSQKHIHENSATLSHKLLHAKNKKHSHS